MKVLFIGGTGNISTSASKRCIEKGIDLFLLNRGTRDIVIPGANVINADISDFEEVKYKLKDHNWNAVVNWIAFEEKDIQRDIELFRDKTKQYIFISSASAYQKPPLHPVITEFTPLDNPFWLYSRNKIACEERLIKEYKDENFPITIVRPSLTYDTVIPVAIGGWNEYNIIERMKKGEKIIVHGDGTSLWTITHADDFAIGFTGLIGNQNSIGQTFHITSDEILTWNQIYMATAAAVKAEPNIVHIPSDFIVQNEPKFEGTLLGDKSHSVIFDNTKIKTFVPEFKASIPFSAGIKRTIDWFESNPNRKIINSNTEELMNRIISKFENKK